MTTKLVYTGSVPITFMGFNLAVEPGDTFHVPDHLLESFISRPDIELAPEAPTAPEPEPVLEEPAKPTKKAAQ